MGHARAATFVGSAGQCVVASGACCGPGVAPVGGEWLCVAGVYRLHGGAGASGSGVAWVRGRLPASGGCQDLTVGGSSVCLLHASRGRPWSASCWGFLQCTPSNWLQAVSSVEEQGPHSQFTVGNPPQHGGCSCHVHPSSADQQFRQVACCRPTLGDIVAGGAQITLGVPLGQVGCSAHHHPQTIGRISRSA